MSLLLLFIASALTWFGLKYIQKKIKQKRQPRQKTQQVEEYANATEQGADRWDGWFYEAEQQRYLQKNVIIRYLDASDKPSQRMVRVKGFEPNRPDGLLFGFCELRNANRTFRFDRIQHAIDADTGEILPNLQAWLNQEYEALPIAALDRILSDHYDEIQILLYAAKADGAMRAAELQVITKHCQAITGDDRITTSDVKKLLGDLEVPDTKAFTRLYQRLKKTRPTAAAEVAELCRNVVATQKTIHPKEQEMLDAL